MESRIIEIAERVRALRDIMGFLPEEMAAACGVTQEEYLAHESGAVDFSVTFLCSCAEKFGVDLMELMTGENPRLSGYSVVRKGTGLVVKRRAGFYYEHLAYSFKNKAAEPFFVKAPYQADAQDAPIHLSSHEGQEFDYVLRGQLKICIDGHEETLREGDAVYYNAGTPHGMIAVGGGDCEFLAIVIKKQEEEDV